MTELITATRREYFISTLSLKPLLTLFYREGREGDNEPMDFSLDKRRRVVNSAFQGGVEPEKKRALALIKKYDVFGVAVIRYDIDHLCPNFFRVPN